MYKKDRDELRGNFYYNFTPKDPGLQLYDKNCITDAEKGCQLQNNMILSLESGTCIGDYTKDAIVFSMFTGKYYKVEQLNIPDTENLVYYQPMCQFICRDVYDGTVFGWDADFLLCNNVAACERLLSILDFMDDNNMPVFSSNGVQISQVYCRSGKYHTVEITDGTPDGTWSGRVWDFHGAMLPDDIRHQVYVLYQYVCDHMCQILFDYIGDDVNMIFYRLKDRYPEAWRELIAK